MKPSRSAENGWSARSTVTQVLGPGSSAVEPGSRKHIAVASIRYGPGTTSAGRCSQRKRCRGASFVGVHSRCSGVVDPVTAVSKESRFRSQYGSPPGGVTRTAKPASRETRCRWRSKASSIAPSPR